MAKSKKFLKLTTTLEELTMRLIGMGYTCLSGDMFLDNRTMAREIIVREKEPCFYAYPKKCIDCQLETINVWNPIGRYFLDIDFDFSGQMQKNSIKMHVANSMFSRQKAIQLANKFIFNETENA